MALEIVYLEDRPSQEFGLNIEGVEYRMTFMFNTISCTWSVTICISGDDCPIVAGKFLKPRVNLLDNVVTTHYLTLIERPGLSGVDAFTRLTEPLNDGVPSSFLVLGLVEDFTAPEVLNPVC